MPTAFRSIRSSAKAPPPAAKVALFAVAIALVLGAVFYGLNNTSTGNQASNTPATQTAQQARLPIRPRLPACAT